MEEPHIKIPIGGWAKSLKGTPKYRGRRHRVLCRNWLGARMRNSWQSALGMLQTFAKPRKNKYSWRPIQFPVGYRIPANDIRRRTRQICFRAPSFHRACWRRHTISWFRPQKSARAALWHSFERNRTWRRLNKNTPAWGSGKGFPRCS